MISPLALTPPSADRRRVRLGDAVPVHENGALGLSAANAHKFTLRFFFLFAFLRGKSAGISPSLRIGKSAPNERRETMGDVAPVISALRKYIPTHYIVSCAEKIPNTKEIPSCVVALFPEDNVITEDDPKPVQVGEKFINR